MDDVAERIERILPKLSWLFSLSDTSPLTITLYITKDLCFLNMFSSLTQPVISRREGNAEVLSNMDAGWITWVTIFLFRFCLSSFKPWFLKQSLWRWRQNTMTNQRLFQYIIFIHTFINCGLKQNFSSKRLPHSIKIKYPFIFIKIYLQNYELINHILIIVKKWSLIP